MAKNNKNKTKMNDDDDDDGDDAKRLYNYVLLF